MDRAYRSYLRQYRTFLPCSNSKSMCIFLAQVHMLSHPLPDYLQCLSHARSFKHGNVFSCVLILMVVFLTGGKQCIGGREIHWSCYSEEEESNSKGEKHLPALHPD